MRTSLAKYHLPFIFIVILFDMASDKSFKTSQTLAVSPFTKIRHFSEGSYQSVNNFLTKYLFYCEILARQPVNGAAHTLEDFRAFEVERILRVRQTLHVVLKL